MNDGGSAAEHNALWLYGLPGSGVAVPQAAGAPSLQELEQRLNEHYARWEELAQRES